MLSIKEYLGKIRPYSSKMINDLTTPGEPKIQLTIAINFISSKDSKETCTMHSKSNNIEIMIGNETYEVTEELFEFLLQKYQKVLINERKQFFFDSIDLMFYKLYKISLNRCRSYIDSNKNLIRI